MMCSLLSVVVVTNSIPFQRTTGLVLGNAGLKEVLFLAQIGLLVQPGECGFGAGIGLLETEVARAPVGDEAVLADVVLLAVAKDGIAQDVACLLYTSDAADES